MNINKNISIWRGETTPPTPYHLWLKGDRFYHNNGVKWIENKVDLASPYDDGLMSKEDKRKLDEHVSSTDNPHNTTKAQIGLSNVDNTSDLDKPISNLTRLILDTKVDKILGSSLVSNDKIINYDAHLANTSNPHSITKAQIGLSNVTNDALVKRSEMGVAGGVATLDEKGKIFSFLLPAYVDDVLEGTLINTTTFLLAEGLHGEVQLSNIIYVDTTTNKSYRWSGTQYVTIASDLALGETSSTAYSGDKGKQVTDRVTEVYGNNSVINSLSDVVFDSDNTETQTLSADNVLKTWNGNYTSHNIEIPYATLNKAGVMSAIDKTKLDNVEFYRFYSIDFLEGTIALEFIPDRSITIIDHLLYNINTVQVTAGESILSQELENNMVLPADTLITWEIIKNSDQLPALIGIKFKYNEN